MVRLSHLISNFTECVKHKFKYKARSVKSFWSLFWRSLFFPLFFSIRFFRQNRAFVDRMAKWPVLFLNAEFRRRFGDFREWPPNVNHHVGTMTSYTDGPSNTSIKIIGVLSIASLIDMAYDKIFSPGRRCRWPSYLINEAPFQVIKIDTTCGCKPVR